MIGELERKDQVSLIFLYLFGMAAFREYEFSNLLCCEFKTQFVLGDACGYPSVPMIE